MSNIKPGDLVVIFKASIARKFMTHEFEWIDRSNTPHLVLWSSVVCDPDSGQPNVCVLMCSENVKGIFEFPQDALVHA